LRHFEEFFGKRRQLAGGQAGRAAPFPAVCALGFVSMFMDISSEMVHSLLPVYLVTVLGTSTLAVGFIEGIAEATANITKIVGAFVGPFAAIALMALSSNNFRFVFWMAVCRRSSRWP
jgi:hypothetical protein